MTRFPCVGEAEQQKVMNTASDGVHVFLIDHSYKIRDKESSVSVQEFIRTVLKKGK